MMKKMYTQPDAEVQLLSLADILLLSEDTEFNDEEGWLAGFTVNKNANTANSSRFGAIK